MVWPMFFNYCCPSCKTQKIIWRRTILFQQWRTDRSVWENFACLSAKQNEAHSPAAFTEFCNNAARMWGGGFYQSFSSKLNIVFIYSDDGRTKFQNFKKLKRELLAHQNWWRIKFDRPPTNKNGSHMSESMWRNAVSEK